MNTPRAWVDYLSRIELPVLANTLQRIHEMADSSRSTVQQLASVILNDAQLTSQVLRLSNTVFYNQTRAQVTTVSRAITLIGFESVKSMAISSLIVDSLLARSNSPHLIRCLARAVHASVQARCLWPGKSASTQEEVFIGGLLINIGELAFWACDTAQAQELADALDSRDDNPVDLQKEILSATFAEITRGLVEAWSLGPFIRDVVAAGRANSAAANLVRHAMEMATLSEQGWQGAAMDKVLDTLAADTELPVIAVRDQVRLNAQEAGRVAESLGIPDASQLIPGNRPAVASRPPARPDPERQLTLLRELTELLAEQPDINAIFQLVVDGIHHAVGLQRVALLMLEKSGQVMTLRRLAGDPQLVRRWKDSFQVSADGGGTLGGLLPGERGGYFIPPRQRLSSDRETGLGQLPALVAPLRAAGRLAGMVYADNGLDGPPPDEEQLKGFNHFVHHAQLCLALLARH
ncbi:MAG: HDOD domain-containing protein [Marinobacter sp.]|nr:HDOD domain-containing protein [Marinobacter sp.]